MKKAQAPATIFEKTATGVVEKTATGVVEKTATGVVEKTATGVVEKTATGGVEKTATGGVEKSATGASTGKLAIKQGRGHLTYDALIEAGFKLLMERDIEDISIFELARVAGYSVGAFYARFRSKDEFFDALIAKHIERRNATHKHLVETLPRAELVSELVANIVDYYWDHHVFWRAVMRRSLRELSYWEPFRQHFDDSMRRFTSRIEQEIGRELTAKENRSLTFAFQTMMGTINISIVAQPGPVFIGHALFKEELTRAFVQVSGLEHILAEGGNGKTASC